MSIETHSSFPRSSGRPELRLISSASDIELYSYGDLLFLSSKSPEADMSYHFDQETNTWNLEELSSQKPGGGKGILREFAHRVGHNQSISVLAVTEPFTLARLEEVGVLQHVHLTQLPVILTHPSPLLDSLKIVRVLTGGSIAVHRLIVAPIPPDYLDLDEDNPYRVEISLFGTTR